MRTIFQTLTPTCGVVDALDLCFGKGAVVDADAH